MRDLPILDQIRSIESKEPLILASFTDWKPYKMSTVFDICTRLVSEDKILRLQMLKPRNFTLKEYIE
jgi:hypothetical protein